MNKTLLLIFATILSTSFLSAQILNDFDGNQNITFSGWPNSPTIVSNPSSTGINTSANCAEYMRGGDQWAHAYSDLATPLDFSVNHTFELKVMSPIICTILFKLELQGSPTTFVEVSQTISTINEWNQLSFSFPAAQSNLYDKIVIFFDFSSFVDNTFYFDDLELVGGGTSLDQISLPVTFEDPNVDYTLTDFEGNSTSLVTDPVNGSNTVAKSIKTTGAQAWAGTTISTPLGFSQAIAFSATDTKMSVKVYSPAAGLPVRLKVEDHTDNTHTCETETLTTVANTWETLEFDFSNEAPGTAALDLSYTFDKASIFFDFGTAGAGDEFYWDDVEFMGAPPAGSLIINPSDGDINVPINTNANFNFTLPITKLNGDPITVGDIASYFIFKEDNASGIDVPFSGTIDGASKIVTLDPNSDLDYAKTYYIAVLENSLKYDNGDTVAAQNSIFSTPASAPTIVMYEDFDNESGLIWGFWDDWQGGFFDENSTNPESTGNPSGIVGNFYKSSGSNEWTHGFAILGGKLDLSIINEFRWKVYSETATTFSFKLQDNDNPEPWTTEVTVDYTIQNVNTWEEAILDFSSASSRTDLDKIVIMVNGGNVAEGSYFIDDIQGPPFTAPGTSPVAQQAVVSNYGFAVELGFDKDIAGPVKNAENFRITLNNTATITIDTTYLKSGDASTIVLEISTEITESDDAVLSYLQSGTITSADNGVLDNFDDFPITFGSSSVINSLNESVGVFPNPASETFTMQNIAEYSKLSIFNSAGKLVEKSKLQNQNNKTIDISELPDGLYLIQLSDNLGRKTSLKVVKK